MITAAHLREAQIRIAEARADRDALILEALGEDWTQVQIAEALGITQAAVSKVIGGRGGRGRGRRPTRGGDAPSV
jgi:DNA-binding MarR family transcriptional regulator